MIYDQGNRGQTTGRMLRGLLLAALACSLALPAAAQEEARKFELGLDLGFSYLGGDLVDGKDRLGRVRGGLFLTERFELEAEWSRIDTDVEADLDRLLLNAVFNFGLRDGGESYLLAGIGRADIDFEEPGPGRRNDHSSTVQVALGKRFFVGDTSRLAARFQVSLWREQIFNSGSTVNAGVTGGLTWRSAGSQPARTGLVGGRVWIDEDGDGLDDTGSEPSLAGVTVSVSRDDEAVAPPAVTDDQGRYAFAPLAPGAYRLEFSVPEEFRVAPDSARRLVEVVAGGQVEAGLGALRREWIGFSADGLDGRVSGRVWLDREQDGAYESGEGLSGIGVLLTREGESAGRETLAGEAGEFSFDGCLPGAFRVELIDSSALLDHRLAPGTSPKRVKVPAPVGLAANALRDTVTGLVWVDRDADGEPDEGEPGIAGARLRLSPRAGEGGEEAGTGPQGQFRFEAPAGGTHELTLLDSPELDGMPIRPGTSPRTLDVPARFAMIVGVIRDRINGRAGSDSDASGRLDADETGLAGVSVRLSRAPGFASEANSRGDGSFGWRDLPAGTYQVEAMVDSPPAGHWVPDGAWRRTVEVSSPVGLLAEGLEERIEGRLWVDENRNRQLDDSEPGVPGGEVVVSRDESAAGRGIAGPDGGFGVEELAAGTYQVAVAGSLPPGMWPDPENSSREVEVLPVRPGSIGGRVWIDGTAGGGFDESEGALTGALMVLRRGGQEFAAAKTGAGGGYEFTDLEPGTYEVKMRPEPTAGLGALGPLVRSAEVLRATRTDVSFALALVEPPPSLWLLWLALIALSLGTLVWLVHRWWKYGNMLAPCFRLWRIFRGRERAALQRQIDAARRGGLEELERVSKKLGRVCCADWDIATDYFLAHRSHQGWARMAAIAAAMSPHLASKLLIRQQEAFALNRAGNGEQAEEILEKLRDRRGPSAETCGLLGRVYKDRWDAARRSGDAAGAAARLEQAIATYREGHEAQSSDPYPGINMVTLMEFTEAPAGDRKALRQAVRKAADGKARSPAADYWAWATLLELAMHELDEAAARQALERAVEATDERWQYETTLRNLRLVRAAREARGDAAPAWTLEVEATLERAFAAGAV